MTKDKESYFVISTGPDGTSFYEFTKKELEKKLNDEYWGEVEFGDCLQDPDYFNGLVVIKGRIVVPKEAKKVIEWNLT